MLYRLIFALLFIGCSGLPADDENKGSLLPFGEKASGTPPPAPTPTPTPTPAPSQNKPEKPSEVKPDTGNCPIACPEGWVRFGFSEHCYKLPAQPAHLDTFWEHDRRCKEMEPTSYIAVMNGLVEQAVATPIAFQYAPNWFALLTNGFMWLGGYTNDKGWRFLDGSDESSNVLMAGANIIGSNKNDTCLGADPKTLGFWQTRPCSDKTGAAICEMAPRRVCGKQGSILPIAPIDLTEIGNLFPKLYSIPYIGQVFADSGLDYAVSSVGNSISCLLGIGDCKGSGSAKPTPLPKGCRLDCPAGWFSWDRSPTSKCYYIDPEADFDTFWNLEGKCRRMEDAAHVTMVRTLVEQSTATAVAKNYGQKWEQENPKGFLWRGIYSDQSRWYDVAGADYTANLYLAMADLPIRIPESFKGHNNTCVGADIKDAGKWHTVPCDDKNGLAICEMPKKTLCGSLPAGQVSSFQPEELTVKELQALFPGAKKVPFLDSVLAGRQNKFNPSKARNVNATGVTYGDAYVNVICAKAGTGLHAMVNSKPDWIWLKVNGQYGSIGGQWVKVGCKSGSVDAFKVSALGYLSVWARCYNQGYEVAMPGTASLVGGWYPFRVDDYLTEYYRKGSGGIFSSLLGTYRKIPITKVGDC